MYRRLLLVGRSPDDDRTLGPGAAVGPYRIEAELGRGRMGVVYRARRDDGVAVALKILRPELASDPTYRRRFAREGALAARVRDEHLVPVIDRGESGSWWYLAARYVAGGSLATRLERGVLSIPELVRTVAHVGAGIDALHRAGLVHRDVNPSNVMLDERGGAALTDFGLARGEADTVLTTDGRVVGTPDYLAPEVIRGERAGPRTDVYGLGCLAYACAVGHPPFADQRTVGEVCAAHLRDDPAEPSLERPDLPSPFGDALLTALAKDPARRPATGTAYALLLRAGARSA